MTDDGRKQRNSPPVSVAFWPTGMPGVALGAFRVSGASVGGPFDLVVSEVYPIPDPSRYGKGYDPRKAVANGDLDPTYRDAMEAVSATNSSPESWAQYASDVVRSQMNSIDPRAIDGDWLGVDTYLSVDPAALTGAASDLSHKTHLALDLMDAPWFRTLCGTLGNSLGIDDGRACLIMAVGAELADEIVRQAWHEIGPTFGRLSRISNGNFAKALHGAIETAIYMPVDVDLLLGPGLDHVRHHLNDFVDPKSLDGWIAAIRKQRNAIQSRKPTIRR